MTAQKGEFRPLANGFEARIRIDATTRRGFELVAFPRDEAAARERCTAMAEIATRLRKTGHTADTPKLLDVAARARGKAWEAVLEAVDLLCGGTTVVAGTADGLTIRKLGEQWRSGELHARHRDHIGPKKEKSVSRDGEFAKLYVDPHIGDRAVAGITLEHCEVMAEIPATKSTALRRGVAQYLNRLLAMAVYPLRLRTVNPIPRGWLPRAGAEKAKECLYPDEDRALLACTDVPLIRRLFFGMAGREGGRTEEQASLTWADVDLERGRISLDENKMDDPRDWDLDPGVWRALKAWKARSPDAVPRDHVLVEDGVPLNVNRLAYHLRRDLRKAGVTREKLYESSASRRPIRAHDLRATFVTIALATGRTETWVSDRTGHRSSTMINRYRRKARGWNLGGLDALDVAIPDLEAPHACPIGVDSGATSGPPVVTKALETSLPVQSGLLNPHLNIAFTSSSCVLRGSVALSPHEGRRQSHRPIE